MKVRFLFVAFLLVITVCNLGRAQEPTPSPSPKVVPPPLTQLPESVLETELKSARGLPFKLSDYSGKVLVINFWATWVGPSRNEIPTLVKLQKDYWSRGVRVVGLSTENPEESSESVPEMIRDYKIQYKVGWSTTELAATMMQGRDAIPQTYVIARSGRIVRRFVGFNSLLTAGLVRAAVDEALQAEPPPSQPTSP